MFIVKGKLIYQGPNGLDIINYFDNLGFTCPRNSNPADYYMSIMHSENEINRNNYPLYYKSYDEQLKPTVEKSMEDSISGTIPHKKKRNNCLYEIFLIAQRSMLIMIRNPMMVRSRLI